MTLLITFIFIFVFSWLGVGLFRKWSEDRSILDIPNERSSHELPTPVGGGMVIVLFTIGPLVAYELLTGSGVKYWGFYAGALAIALVSWIDDIKPVPPVLRFGVHVIGALLAVWQIGGFREITVWPEYTVGFDFLGPVLTVIWIVWLTNAYNFMDGIDGLAGTQAVVAAAGWALAAAFYGLDLLLFSSILLMASSMGFLVHNWPPAKVFMGDVGSAFLGYSFAVFPLIALNSGSNTINDGVIPFIAAGFVWLFIADTAFTFVRRALSGETVWTAHRKHLYQQLIKAGHSHLRVTLFYAAMMIFVAASALAEVKFRIFGLTPVVCIVILVTVAAVVIQSKRTS